MAIAAAHPRPRITPKARQTWEFLGEHQRRMAERRGGLRKFYCGNPECAELLFEYVIPIGFFIQRCTHCKTWQTLTTEANDR